VANYEYGSQRELLQYLIDPAHRLRINRLLLADSPSLKQFARVPAAIDWISPDPVSGKELKDAAWSKVGLRPPSPQAAGWWPASGPTWDAVAKVTGADGQTGAIFVEAKGRVPEIRSSGCQSRDPTNLTLITHAFHDVQNGLGLPKTPTWLGPTYQLANRLAWLWFAREHDAHRADSLPVWLLSIYFCGVSYRAVKPVVGPASEQEWRPEIKKFHDEMGCWGPGSDRTPD